MVGSGFCPQGHNEVLMAPSTCGDDIAKLVCKQGLTSRRVLV